LKKSRAGGSAAEDGRNGVAVGSYRGTICYN
jgi:hypothetical protein